MFMFEFDTFDTLTTIELFCGCFAIGHCDWKKNNCEFNFQRLEIKNSFSIKMQPATQ